jgi:hypothetical protein
MDVPWFVVAQFLGGIAATLLFRWLVPHLQSGLKKFSSLMVQSGIPSPVVLLPSLGFARTVPKPYSFVPWGLALSEKQTPQVIEEVEKPNEQMEGLESSVVFRRQMLYLRELRMRQASSF